jgi:predicted DCC family thiol-disulfide oxidoreductase YuxK
MRISAPTPVFYDGKCSFCIASMTALSRLDWLGRFCWIDMNPDEAKKKFPDLDLNRGRMELLVRRSDGRWFGGFDGLRDIAQGLPIFWVILPLLYIPPISNVGRWIYKRVAERRYCLLPTRIGPPRM